MLYRAINDAERVGHGVGQIIMLREHEDVVTRLLEHMQILTQETKLPPLQNDVTFLSCPDQSEQTNSSLSYTWGQNKGWRGKQNNLLLWRSPPFNTEQEEEIKIIRLKCFDINSGGGVFFFPILASAAKAASGFQTLNEHVWAPSLQWSPTLLKKSSLSVPIYTRQHPPQINLNPGWSWTSSLPSRATHPGISAVYLHTCLPNSCSTTTSFNQSSPPPLGEGLPLPPPPGSGPLLQDSSQLSPEEAGNLNCAGWETAPLCKHSNLL